LSPPKLHTQISDPRQILSVLCGKMKKCVIDSLIDTIARSNDEDMMVGVRAHCVSLMKRGASWGSVMYAIRRSTELKRVSNMAADCTAYLRNPVMSSTYTAR